MQPIESGPNTLAPLAVDAAGFAALACISRAQVFKLNSSGRCPAPVRIGRCCRWPVDAIKIWIANGCPPRDRAKAERWQRDKGRELAELAQQGGAQ